MWWVQNPSRLKQEVAAVEALRDASPWLTAATPRPLKGLRFGFDFDVTIDDQTYPFLLSYPALFPAAPPEVTPRDGRRLSNHQYGDGGEMCLEYRADNWDPAIMGAMMMESAYRLLSAERPGAIEQAAAPSAHRTSIGQDLRGQIFRFLLTRTLLDFIGTVPSPSLHQGFVKDVLAPKSIWTAYVSRLGPESAPNWIETSLPIPGDVGVECLLVRMASLAGLPDRPGQATLEQIIQKAGVASPDFFDGVSSRCVVIATANWARAFYSYSKDGGRQVVSYQTVDFSNDSGSRLPPSYDALRSKKVGLVGCGSLGSKIAASLARCGVGAFVLVDDDILKPVWLATNSTASALAPTR
jgi:ubiquitin-protein ligase